MLLLARLKGLNKQACPEELLLFHFISSFVSYPKEYSKSKKKPNKMK